MRTFFWLLAAVLMFCSCTNTTTKKQEEKKPFALKTLLDQFVADNPEMSNNEVTLKDASIKLADLIRQNVGDSLALISELPVEFEMTMEYPNEIYIKTPGMYVAKFGFGEYQSKTKLSDNYKATFIVFSIVDKETVSKLKKGALYNIKGTFKDFANCKGSFQLPSGKCIENPPSVHSYNDGPSFNLGTLIVENLSFEEIGVK